MQHADEDELSSTQQVPEEVGSQNSVPLSQTPQEETQPWRTDAIGDRDGSSACPICSVQSPCLWRRIPSTSTALCRRRPTWVVGAHRPEVFHMENPPWLPDLKLGIKQLQDKQDQILKVADENSKEFSTCSIRCMMLFPEWKRVKLFRTNTPRGIQALRREIQELRTRSVSPAPNVTPNRGTSPASPITPRGADTRYDDLQIACGGWQDAKRHAIETNFVRLLVVQEESPFF